MTKIKHVYVDGKLVGIGDVKIEEIEKEPKYFLKVFHNDSASYPFEDDETISFYSNHKQYVWDGKKLDELLDKFDEVPKKAEELIELLNKTDDDYFYVAVYGFEHSGLSISLTPFDCPWDSGLLGILQIDKSCSDLQKIVENWIKLVTMLLDGEVYCVEVIDELGECVYSIDGIYAKNTEEFIENVSGYISNEYHLTDEDYKKAYENKINI